KPEGTPRPQDVAQTAADLVKAAPAVQNPVLREEVHKEANKLVAAVEKTQDPVVKTDALKTIGVAAADAGQPAVLTQAVKSVEAIADAQPERAPQARAAIETIRARAAARQSKN